MFILYIVVVAKFPKIGKEECNTIFTELSFKNPNKVWRGGNSEMFT